MFFWGAFEQAGGLMNIYAFEKTNRFIESISFEVPATWFPISQCWIHSIICSCCWKILVLVEFIRKRIIIIIQMAVGVIIMALGFAVMSEAALEFERNGSSAVLFSSSLFIAHIR